MKIIVCLIVSMLAADAALADTFKCNAVTTEAVLGYDGPEAVAIFGEDQICQFSIGNSSPNGQQQNVTTGWAPADLQLLKSDLNQFLASRLASIATGAASKFGENGSFFRERIQVGQSFSELSCGSEIKPLLIQGISVNCLNFSEILPESGRVFESKVISATIYRPSYIFEFTDAENPARSLTLFASY